MTARDDAQQPDDHTGHYHRMTIPDQPERSPEAQLRVAMIQFLTQAVATTGDAVPALIREHLVVLVRQHAEAEQEVRDLIERIEAWRACLAQAPAEQPAKFSMDVARELAWAGARGRAVRAAGGGYTECRGHETERHVVLPNTPLGRRVVAELADAQMAHNATLGGRKTPLVWLRVSPAFASSIATAASTQLQADSFPEPVLLEAVANVNGVALRAEIHRLEERLARARRNV